MYWGGLRLFAEDVLGGFHCHLRARRTDCDGPATWDDVYSGTLNPPGDIPTEIDLVAWILWTIANDLDAESETGLT